MAKQRAHVDRDRLSRALSAFVADHSLTQAELAERLGTSQPTVSDWLKQQATPSPASLARILQVLHIHASDVAPLPSGSAASSVPGVVFIPRAGRVGGGALPVPPDDDEPDADPYPEAELRRLLGYSPSGLRSAVVVGDSMSPRLRPGDRVIYLPITEIGDHGMYILIVDGAQIVKFVQTFGGGVLSLIPENTRYQTEMYVPTDDSDGHLFRSEVTGRVASITVVGKVVYHSVLA